MDTLFTAVEGTALSQALRTARWGYAAVNATHILGIALLIGATVTLNLRYLGLWPSVPRHTLVRVLAPVAATGLALAVCAGLMLYSVRAREYAGLGFFQAKLVLITIAVLSALWLHRRHGMALETAGGASLKAHALLSLACWTGALICGRLIAFADD